MEIDPLVFWVTAATALGAAVAMLPVCVLLLFTLAWRKR